MRDIAIAGPSMRQGPVTDRDLVSIKTTATSSPPAGVARWRATVILTSAPGPDTPVVPPAPATTGLWCSWRRGSTHPKVSWWCMDLQHPCLSLLCVFPRCLHCSFFYRPYLLPNGSFVSTSSVLATSYISRVYDPKKKIVLCDESIHDSSCIPLSCLHYIILTWYKPSVTAINPSVAGDSLPTTQVILLCDLLVLEVATAPLGLALMTSSCWLVLEIRRREREGERCWSLIIWEG